MLHHIEESEAGERWSLRESPIVFDEDDAKNAGNKSSEPGQAGDASAPAAAASNNGLPAGITDVRGLTDEDVNELVDKCRGKLEWEKTTGSAKKWWETFEEENKHRPALILRLCEELVNRDATISEFFLSYVYSNTDNIQANLHYLDYSRLKKEEESRKESDGSS